MPVTRISTVLPAVRSKSGRGVFVLDLTFRSLSNELKSGKADLDYGDSTEEEGLEMSAFPTLSD